ncbi:MAG: 1-acyl-sn-glycerol-3-phosphate acyltransferase [Rhodobacteraceae bacterium]|nr:1-acyl-sn-glycerol-3-phosphate acyltransferase [Paracoccaceae bacterium]
MPLVHPKGLAWLRVAWKGGLIGLLTFGGLAVLLLVRLVERPVFGLRRPVTPYITQAVCRGFFHILGLPFDQKGRPMQGQGAVVANHSSWLDIFVLNARKNIYFVSKSEVAGWPGIGWLARATGTLFINRTSREAKAQTEVFVHRLHAGHKLLFFPEGTSTDGQSVIEFKSTLFAAFFDDALRTDMEIQPVSVVFHPPKGQDPRFYCWWGDMGFGEHLLHVLAAPRHGRAEVIYHPPLRVAAFENRKLLAHQLHAQITESHAAARQ